MKIIFLQSSGGSFDAPAAVGTSPAAGSGLQATRIFNADGSTLASSLWPSWFTSFEIGISGSANTPSTNTACARFASSTESATTNCTVGGSTTTCGATEGLYRVSEADCMNATSGNGGPYDGIYMRATFNRDTSALAATENLLVVLEYSAASVNPAPPNPTSCFTASAFTPEKCSDFVWKAYIKHSAADIVQPFLMLIPPYFTSVLPQGIATPSPQNPGAGVAAKQFFIPLAGDSSLTVLQISRVGSNYTGSTSTAGTSAYNLVRYCNTNSPSAANSPLCAGVVFYSITFYRI